ncbi:FAD-dependent pyridine nucleotide-disulfide oxidoreductase [Penicillium chermesinum]|nr:FAD-dependent pyridine nucleotide-disulfide oxidoreductase [Penicillium chermesinum]
MVRLGSLLPAVLLACGLVAAEPIPKTDYDVIIVGGGPAGLSALSGVSRVRRKALLFDNHHYRNAVTREMHDVIGNDGTVPSVFRAEARKQIERYPTAHFSNSTVTNITSVGDEDFTIFNVTDHTGKHYSARKIVLATGLRDVLPSTPGIAAAWGKGLFWCPWCDGYEHRDQPFGIISNIADRAGDQHPFSDIIAFVNGTYTPAGEAAAQSQHDKWLEQLNAWNVTIENRTISSLERIQDGGVHRNKTIDEQYDKFLVHFTEGEPIERNAFIINAPTVQYSQLPAQMGLNITNNKIDVVTSSMRTSQAGVWAIGDANSDGSTNVPHAMFSGKKASVYLHVELSREDPASKISKRSGLSEEELVEEASNAIGSGLDRHYKKIMGRH